MSEAELNGRYPNGGIREIDEYLHGTICEIVADEEDLNDIEAPDGEEFDVDMRVEQEEIDDDYLKKSLTKEM